MEFTNRDGRLENFFFLKFLYKVNRKTICPNGEIPANPQKTLGSVVKKLGMVR